MSRKNIAAFTEIYSHYPAYISVNREIDGQYTITMRKRGSDSGVTIEISENDLILLAENIINNIDKRI